MLFDNNKKEKPPNIAVVRSKPLKAKERSPVIMTMTHSFVSIHGFFFSFGGEIEEMNRLYTSIIDDIGLLLRSSAIGPDLLNKLVVVNIFSVKHTQQKLEKNLYFYFYINIYI